MRARGQGEGKGGRHVKMESVTLPLVWVLRLQKVGREPVLSISNRLRIARTATRGRAYEAPWNHFPDHSPRLGFSKEEPGAGREDFITDWAWRSSNIWQEHWGK